MATSAVEDERLESPLGPRYRRPRLPTTSGVSGLADRYNYGTIIHNRVFIGGLHSSVTEEDLRKKFTEHGEISEIKIIKKPEQEKGYAFVTFQAPEIAKKVLEESGSRVKINGMDSKLGPAIRKPSTTDSPPNDAGFKKAGFVMQPMLTPKRSRLTSCPDGEFGLGYDPSNPAPIPVPISGTQAPNSTPERPYNTNQNLLSQYSHHELNQILLAARLMQASSNFLNVNPAAITQALLMNQMQMNNNNNNNNINNNNNNNNSPRSPNGGFNTGTTSQEHVFFPSSFTGSPTYATAAVSQNGSSHQVQGVLTGHLGSLAPPMTPLSPMNFALQIPQTSNQNIYAQSYEQHQQNQQHQQQAQQNQMAFNNASQIIASAANLGLDLNPGNLNLIGTQMNGVGGQHVEQQLGLSGGGAGSLNHGSWQGVSGQQSAAVMMHSPLAASMPSGSGFLGSIPEQGNMGGTFQFDIEATSSPE